MRIKTQDQLELDDLDDLLLFLGDLDLYDFLLLQRELDDDDEVLEDEDFEDCELLLFLEPRSRLELDEDEELDDLLLEKFS